MPLYHHAFIELKRLGSFLFFFPYLFLDDPSWHSDLKQIILTHIRQSYPRKALWLIHAPLKKHKGAPVIITISKSLYNIEEDILHRNHLSVILYRIKAP